MPELHHPDSAAPSRRPQRPIAAGTGIVLLLAAPVALAHTAGDGATALVHHGFIAGLLHPWSGVDHLAAMLAVGLWSATTTRHWWLAPLVFAQMLLAGALLGLSGAESPAVEPMIAASLVVLGLLLAARTSLPALAGAGLVGLFAIFHGMAHGHELAGSQQPWHPLAGMLLSTIALHAIGICAGLALRARHQAWARVAGVLVSVAGGALLLQLA
ncbi:HupE/UreJ family protein [Comamonadaceae bacterium G21597-S1]|nr:HupE/UreJ family protein [Comamonadaceae bacterium G21597-S1]